MLFLLLLTLCLAVSPRTLLARNVENGLVKADEKILNSVFEGTRDFHVVMLMTGEGSNVQCPFCDIIGPNFRTVAQSYKPEGEPEVFFLLADMSDCMQSFRKLGLQQIPNVAVWPPSSSRSDIKLGINAKHTFMSFQSSGDQEEELVKLLKTLGHNIEIVKPFPVKNFLRFVATLFLVAGSAFFMRQKVLKVWQAKKIWMALSLVAVVLFCAGHMFNSTRGTPFMGHDGKVAQLIERNFNSQFAVETQIVSLMYAGLAFATIMLLKFVPKLNTPKEQTYAAVFGAVVVLLVYSLFLDLFSAKMGGFSLTLLPLHIFS